MRQIVTKAIVLRRINYQEADRIITFLTSYQGKLVAIAKGARKANSKLAGSIELFCTSQLIYLPGKGSVSTLISARLIKNYDYIVRNLGRTQLTYNILKLIDKTLEDASGDEYYDLLEETLEYINDKDLDINLTLLWFELQFLSLMGHMPSNATKELKNSSSDKYSFDFDKMKFIENENGTYKTNHVKLFLLSLSNTPSQLKRINNVSDLTDKLSDLSQNLMITNNFSKL